MQCEHKLLQEWDEILSFIPQFEEPEDISWEVMDEKRLIAFFKENYNMGQENALEWENCLTRQKTFLGFEYTYAGIVQNTGHGYLYVVGTADTKSGKKAVVAITKLAPNSFLFSGYMYKGKDIVLLAYAEVNYFCQGRHLFREMAEKIADVCQGKVLAYTHESEMGKQLNVGQKLRDIMAKSGNPDCYEEKELANMPIKLK